MRRIALAIAGLVVLAILIQALQINLHTGIFSEPAIITICILAEYGLLALSILMWRYYHNEHERFNKLSEQKSNLELAYSENKTLFDKLFESATTGIVLLELDGRIKKANSEFCQLLGYLTQEIIQKNYFELLDKDLLVDIQKNIQKMINNEVKHDQHEIKIPKKNGEYIWLKSKMCLIRNNENIPTGIIVHCLNTTQQKEAEEKLSHMAYHDPLTGLANRNKLEQFINHILSSSRRQKTGFAIIFLDLDGFKNINDSIGHDAGDIILQIIAERLKSAVRNTDLVARLGGDEFVLLISDVKKPESAAIIAKKILESVLESIVIQGQEIYMTASLGISLYPNDGQNVQTLMKHADLALYRSKELGRNNYQFYTIEMTTKAHEKLTLQSALGHALAKNEFILNYQPKIELKTRKITGVEAYLRWKNNDYVGTTPNEIIELAEETGLIIPVSEWVMKTACIQLKKWHEMGFSALVMGVNCSARQFKNTGFVDKVFSSIKEAKILPNCLELEITEAAIMEDPENTIRVLYQLKDIGVQIVIDDFGTGYWSLNNLRRLSVSKIKIDRTFIKQCIFDETSAAIVKAIIAMANKLNIKSVAEGVETRDQYEFLMNEGCTEIQGYYLTRPLSDEMMSKFLKHPIPDAEIIISRDTTT